MKKWKEGEMKKFPWITIIKNSGTFICEICKLLFPRHQFVVNYFLIFGKILKRHLLTLGSFFCGLFSFFFCIL
jgi:hypothetical protein